MNKDINKTLMALVPILRMNGENVTNIEAVHDWYKDGDREYMKEVAEITYNNGTVRYADIGCDSNLTAIYDVIAVIQQIKPRSKAIERIERGVYSLPSAQPERDIPIKPIETTDKAWGIPKRQAVCPKCDYYLGHVAFLGDYKGKRITYCETCGQAIDWEGWKFDE